MSATTPIPSARQGYHIMTKPTGPLCNLACEYCFYLEKECLYGSAEDWTMPDEVLESFVRQYIESQDVPEVTFAWQGGEPTLLGVPFFRKVIALQEQYANGKTIANAFQTNGILIDDEWGAFLADNAVLIGLSVDGPRELHDRYRKDRGGNPTFDRVMRGLEHLKKHNVEFNILACVNRTNAHHPVEVYHFFQEVGSDFIQFIPIVERVMETPREDGITLPSPQSGAEARVAPWTVEPLQYGTFLAGVFDEWIKADVGRYYVQIFDIALEAWLGMNPSLCVLSRTCGRGMALEHNGDLYSCDHYVYPENRLGNILETPIADMVDSDQQRQFGQDKADTLPEYCRQCEVCFVCNGECPKHRFATTPDGEPGLNYLCKGLRHFFNHIDEPMRFMAGELRQNRPPANVMRYMRERDLARKGKAEPGPNDLCICGSGRKYKKCCGRK